MYRLSETVLDSIYDNILCKFYEITDKNFSSKLGFRPEQQNMVLSFPIHTN